RADDDHGSVYASAMSVWPGAALALLLGLRQALPGAPAAPQASPEDEIRAAVQQYYEAQAARDPDRALTFWSAAANPRMTRDTFVALFGPPAEDQISVDIRSVAIAGAEARVRVTAVRTRLETQNGRPLTSRTSFLNSQTWRKEAGGWKLLRDAAFGDELADQYLGASGPERAAFLDQQSPADRAALRYAISQRASMAAIAKDLPRAKTLFGAALDISRATGDRRGEANSLHNLAQADYFLRDYAGATRYYEQELAVARETDDQNAAAAALFGLGSVDYARAEYT